MSPASTKMREGVGVYEGNGRYRESPPSLRQAQDERWEREAQDRPNLPPSRGKRDTLTSILSQDGRGGKRGLDSGFRRNDDYAKGLHSGDGELAGSGSPPSLRQAQDEWWEREAQDRLNLHPLRDKRGGRVDCAWGARPFDRLRVSGVDSRLWRPLHYRQMRHQSQPNHPHPFGRLRTGSIFPRQGGRVKRGGGPNPTPPHHGPLLPQG